MDISGRRKKSNGATIIAGAKDSAFVMQKWAANPHNPMITNQNDWTKFGR